MAAPTFRDRVLSRRGAQAIMSPVGIVAAVAVAVAVLVVGVPAGAAVALGVVVWAINAWRLLPRAPRRERIDPFTLQEPWRRFVQDALQARSRFAESVRRMPAGPLRDRLDEIAARMETGVDECWRIARRGQALVRARRGIDRVGVERQLAQLESGDAGADPSTDAVLQSLRVQRETAERLDGVIDRTQAQLRLLDARLDEAVARTLELSTQASLEATALTGLGADVDGLVTEMESLRLALEETSAASGDGGAGQQGGAP
jgi:hypothetical protein